MDDAAPLPSYTPKMFAASAEECDIVMKGGVTSGIVYPYAILELARRYRFRSIGGTSAGAIAATLAAAAEYARSMRGDPAGFVRLQRHCDALPEQLPHLFQPAPRYRRLVAFLMRVQAGAGALGWIAGVLSIASASALIGLVVGGALLWLLGGGIAGAVLGAVVGIVIAVAMRLLRFVTCDLPASDFGLCPGLDQPGGRGPALTQWLHDAIQDIAFGVDAEAHAPLTFGDLAGGTVDRRLDLRIITTNLGMGRPHTLPVLGIAAAYDPAEWRSLFPAAVCDHLAGVAVGPAHMPGLATFPSPNELPVLVAARMSLAFPLLFTAVPVHVRDFASADLQRATSAAPVIENRRILFADGGISSNFPIHLFDALLPERPTFALSLDDLPRGVALGGDRVFIPTTARQGFGLPARSVRSVGGYLGSILTAAKDWQDQLLSIMPDQRERIAHVLLAGNEGGLNLAMPPEHARALMLRGLEVGRRFADGAFDFDEHRWRRSLIAYDQVDREIRDVHRTWQAGFGNWLLAYMSHPKSYKRLTTADRTAIHDRIGAVAALEPAFEPPIADQKHKLPRPTGVLRIGPDY